MWLKRLICRSNQSLHDITVICHVEGWWHIYHFWVRSFWSTETLLGLDFNKLKKKKAFVMLLLIRKTNKKVMINWENMVQVEALKTFFPQRNLPHRFSFHHHIFPAICHSFPQTPPSKAESLSKFASEILSEILSPRKIIIT